MILRHCKSIKLICAALISTGISAVVIHCDTTGPTPPVSSTPKVISLQLSAPPSGTQYGYTDTITLFTTVDRDSFIGPVYREFSLDSGKSWNMLSDIPWLGRAASQLEGDTVQWSAAFEPAFNTADFTGRGVLIRVYDYNIKYIDRSGFIFFRP